jgi:hypothetical protein
MAGPVPTGGGERTGAHMRLRLTTENSRAATIHAGHGIGRQRARKISRVGCLTTMVIIGLLTAAGPTAGQELTRLGLPPAVPIEKAADVILVLKPHAKQSLHMPATIDRIVDGEIVRVEKGVRPTMIVHTRNTLGSPLEAGVPVKLFLMAFKDGHAHYIIGVFPEGYGGQP